MRNLTRRWIQSNLFPQKFGHFFYVKEGTRQQRESEPGPRIIYKWSGAKKKPLCDKWVRLLTMGETRQIVSTSLLSSKNMNKFSCNQ